MTMPQLGTERVKGAVERVARSILASRLNSNPSVARAERPMPGRTRQGEVDAGWPSAILEARAAIAAYEAAVRDAGLVVVPRELTAEMTRIGALYCNGAIATRLMWEDILAAAPS